MDDAVKRAPKSQGSSHPLTGKRPIYTTATPPTLHPLLPYGPSVVSRRRRRHVHVETDFGRLIQRPRVQEQPIGVENGAAGSGEDGSWSGEGYGLLVFVGCCTPELLLEELQLGDRGPSSPLPAPYIRRQLCARDEDELIPRAVKVRKEESG